MTGWREAVVTSVAMLGMVAPAGGQVIQAIPETTSGSSTSLVLEHVEAPKEVAIGTMAINVWAIVHHPERTSPVAGAEFVWLGESNESRVEMEPVDGAFDSPREVAVVTIDTYAWVDDTAHEYEIRARAGDGPSKAVGRGTIRVRPRISTPDLVLMDVRGNVHPWVGSGVGGFTPATVIPVGPVVSRPSLTDVDGDRLEDLVLPALPGNVIVFHNQGAGRLQKKSEIDCGSDLVAAAVGKLEKGDRPDLVTVSAGRMLDIRLGCEAEPVQTAELTLLPDLLELADLDGDGLDEIYVALLGLQEGEIQVWTRQVGVRPAWAPTGRLASPGGRGRIRALTTVRREKADVLLILAEGTSGDPLAEGVLESWGPSADTDAVSEPSLVSRFRVPGEPLRVLSGSFSDREPSWLAVVREGDGVGLWELRDASDPVRLGEIEEEPQAFAVLDLDGDGDDDLATAGRDLRLWILVRGVGFREAGESPYLLEDPALALLTGSLDEREP